MSELYEENLGDGINLTPEASDIGKRADAFISEKTGMTRSAAVRLIESGDALINGKEFQKNYKLRTGDAVTLEIPEAEPDVAEPENIPLDIVYEDEDIVVVNKPKGMVVHPAAGNPTGTLVNALLYHCKQAMRISVSGFLFEISCIIGNISRIESLTACIFLPCILLEVSTIINIVSTRRTILSQYIQPFPILESSSFNMEIVSDLQC